MFLGQSHFDEQRYLRNAEHAARHRPSSVVDASGRAYRGGQVRSIVGDTVTIMIQLEHNWVGVRTCSASAFQGHTPAVGNPVCVEVDTANNYAIVAVYPAAPADHAAEAAWMRNPEVFNPGRVMPAQGGNP